jgi:hypothetical protein
VTGITVANQFNVIKALLLGRRSSDSVVPFHSEGKRFSSAAKDAPMTVFNSHVIKGLQYSAKKALFGYSFAQYCSILNHARV